MKWTKEHDIVLVREVLTVDPFSQPKGSHERFNLWTSIATALNSIKDGTRFDVTGRSVRDRVNLVLIKNYKKKVAEERRASGISVDPPTELDEAMEEICERSDSSEKLQQAITDEKREKIEREKNIAEEMRKQALEKVGETKKRKHEEEQQKQKKTRKTGGETIEYLKEKLQQEMKIKEDELKWRREVKEAEMSANQNLTTQLLKQQEFQQNMFSAFEKHQQQQMQQQQQLQANYMLQQQQQSQAFLAVLQELTRKK